MFRGYWLYFPQFGILNQGKSGNPGLAGSEISLFWKKSVALFVNFIKPVIINMNFFVGSAL
jgi:hypothetical protein